MIQSVLEKSIGEIFGYDIAEQAKHDAECAFDSRPLYIVGLTSLRILKKFIIPSSVAAAVFKTESGKDDTETKPCRPSELPLYYEEHCRCRSKQKAVTQLGAVEQQIPSALEKQVRVIRKELWVWHDQYRGYREKIVEKVEIAKAHSESTLAYLKEEGNYLPRIGAISLGGLTGIIFGLRGGWIRRLTYGTAGALAMSAMCYPRQASEVSHEALTYARKCVAVTYNFIYGVKPEVLSSESSNPVASDLSSTAAPSEKAEKDTQKKILPNQNSLKDSDLYAERARK